VRRTRAKAPAPVDSSPQTTVTHAPSAGANKQYKRWQKNHGAGGTAVGEIAGAIAANIGKRGGHGDDNPNPYDLSLPQTPEQVQKYIDAQVRLQFGQMSQDLRDQDRNIPKYFDDYRKQMSNLQTTMVGAPGSPTLGGYYGAGLASIGQLGQQLGTANASTVTGLTPGTTQQNLNDAANAALVRQGQLANMGGLVASQGLAENAYLGNRQASSGPLEIQARTDAKKQIIRLKREKGAARVNALQGLRAEAQQAKVDQWAHDFALGKENDDVRNEKRDDRLARLQAKLDALEAGNDVNTWGYSKSEWLAMSPAERQRIIKAQKNYGGSNDSGGSDGDDKPALTPAQIRDARQKSRDAAAEIDDALSRLRDYVGADVPDFNDPENPDKQTGSHTASETEVRNRLKEEGFSSQQIDLAMRIRSGKALNKHQKALARRLGITHLPKRWVRGRKKDNDKPDLDVPDVPIF
jgi:hypothetical protein